MASKTEKLKLKNSLILIMLGFAFLANSCIKDTVYYKTVSLRQKFASSLKASKKSWYYDETDSFSMIEFRNILRDDMAENHVTDDMLGNFNLSEIHIELQDKKHTTFGFADYIEVHTGGTGYFSPVLDYSDSYQRHSVIDIKVKNDRLNSNDSIGYNLGSIVKHKPIVIVNFDNVNSSDTINVIFTLTYQGNVPYYNK
ncbi:hypothetical protein GC194_08860 [bacterium]|nr:hypothetical protein [bacterium]